MMDQGVCIVALGAGVDEIRTTVEGENQKPDRTDGNRRALSRLSLLSLIVLLDALSAEISCDRNQG